MALAYTYHDAYLKAQITEERETRAIAQVAEYGNFSAADTARLAVMRAYIVACLECQAQPDDLFAQKLKHYRDEFDSALTLARNQENRPAIYPGMLMSIEMERN